ncbi:MAG: DNA-processing protein DprA, partial [Spirochaetota bacterium]
YPFNLKNIDSPPAVLYVRGDITNLSRNAVGLVGTRKPSETSQRYAFTTASNLAALNIWVISGLAKGIDAAAHWGAVSTSGTTVGVLGSGQDTIYPAENAALYEKIVDKGGVIMTEYPVGTRPLKHHYPLRNRIISGLSYGIVVVEAGGKSGALITARYALDQGREVFIGPYKETDERAFGNHRLARDGAKTAHTHEDIVAEFANLFALDATYRAMRPRFAAAAKAMPAKQTSQVENAPVPELSEREESIYRAIGEAKHIDDIAVSANMPVNEAASLLMQMEIKGAVKQNPGKYFVRN